MKKAGGLFLAAALILLILSPVVRGEVIKIMSANISSGSSQEYEAPGIRIFQGLEPDVVAIQEFSYGGGTLRDLVDDAFGTEYYYYCEPTGSIPNGVVSRWNILTAGYWSDSYVPDRNHAWAVIDIPGEKDLQVVSIHLKSGESGTQNSQANEIKTHVANDFDDNDYIFVGGDLNATSRSVSCVNTFKTFLDADDHTPADRNGDDDTNEGRTYPYDWAMPNAELDQYHTTLYVGTNNRSYSQGIVFDSHVFPNVATEVSPVQYGDSHVSGMQHMAVMKAYDIPVDTHAEIVDEGFDDFQNGTRPSGWTFFSCDADSDTYTSSSNYGRNLPSLMLDSSDDYILTETFSSPYALTFWMKGMGTDGSSSLLVEELYASSWHTVTSIQPIPTTGTTAGSFSIYNTTTQLRFSYTKSAGNLAFDDVIITGITPTPSPVAPNTPTPSVPPTSTPPPTAPPTAPPTVSYTHLTLPTN